jgi:general secretion pathway protein D
LRNFHSWPLVVAAALVLSSCTTMEQKQQSARAKQADNVANELAATVTVASAPDDAYSWPGSDSADEAAKQPEPYVKSQPTLYMGTDKVVQMPAAQAPIKLYGDAVSLDFEEAPLTEVIHAIMGDILELDYIVEHPINGEVTLRTRTPVPRDQLLEILESLLQANEALMVRDKDGRFFISASGQMSKLNPNMSAASSNMVGYSNIIVPLQYIGAKNMAEILRPVADESAFVLIDPLRNLLVLAGTSTQLDGWQEIITTFDVDLLKGMSVGIFPIENTSISDIEAALASMLGKEGGDGVAEAAGGIGSMIRIIPVERLNSIMVVTPRAHYLARVRTWIERLDQAADANSERRLYVYEVQNSNASHVAELLSTIFAGTGSAGGSSKAGVAPGYTPEKVTSSSGAGDEGNNTPTASQSKNVTVGDVRVVADSENNALLIYATGREYRKIQKAMEQLDVAATQVVIEASIIEVTLTDDLRYGLEWTFDNNLNGNNTGTGQLVNGLGIAARVPGFSYSVVSGGGNIKAVLNALAADDLLNVISSPSLMVLDNQTATIQVGDQVPIESSTTVTDGGNTVSSIVYKDTGVMLSVTPSVNAGGLVTMDVEQSVTDVGPVDEDGAGQRTFLEREINTRVAVRSSESVVLGGLIRENKSSGSSGIPILHSLPLIGPLFGTKSSSGVRTELLVIITPRVIYSDSDLRDVSREMRQQMQGLELIDISRSSSFLSEARLDPVTGEEPVD